MNEREKTIRLWFDMWLNQQDMGIDEDVYKRQAKTKGVHREVESEGRWRQISGLTNRNHIRL